jgi:hypothetical protein
MISTSHSGIGVGQRLRGGRRCLGPERAPEAPIQNIRANQLSGYFTPKASATLRVGYVLTSDIE